MSEFKDWNIDKQLKHVEHMFKKGAEEYKKESTVPLADVIDCMDYWGPWALDEISRLNDLVVLLEETQDRLWKHVDTHEDEIKLLTELAEAYEQCAMSDYHMNEGGPCRHQYRHCTCGKGRVDTALKTWRRSSDDK